jgi:hypothetical protein
MPNKEISSFINLNYIPACESNVKSVTNNGLNIQPTNDKNFKKAKKDVQDIVKNFVGIEKDQRRTFSKRQGDQIWERSMVHPDFDLDFFRIDLFGCIVAKNIKYSKSSPSHKFAYDLEHIVSYSNNGMTIVENGALLNSGANRSKGDTECYKINENEYYGMKTRFGIDPEDLYYDLENNLALTCKKYNLLFIKINNTWSLDKNEYGYSNYENNQRYENFPKNLNVRVDTPEEAALIAGAAGITGIAADAVFGVCLEGYNHAYYGIRENLGYKDEIKETKLSQTQEKLKTIGAVIAAIATGIAVANHIQDNKSKPIPRLFGDN